MKYKIEKNTVQETLILPLYSRKLCTELYPNLYQDETAVRLIDQIDYDFSEAEENSRSLMQRFGALEVAMRQNDLAFEVQAYLKTHPCAAVVNLGCGLDNTGRACDNGRCKIYNLDFPDVIALRQQLLPAGEREQNIPCDLKDPTWLDKIDASGGAVFFASGVFYYFLTQQVRELVQGMADAFSGGVLVFDAANRTAVKMIAKTWLKSAKIKDVGAYFAVSDTERSDAICGIKIEIFRGQTNDLTFSQCAHQCKVHRQMQDGVFHAVQSRPHFLYRSDGALLRGLLGAVRGNRTFDKNAPLHGILEGCTQ